MLQRHCSARISWLHLPHAQNGYAMSRYTIGLLIVCGWFVCFRMFPARFEYNEPDAPFCGTVANYSPPVGFNDGSNMAGLTLFQQNCARCHNNRLEKMSTGPALLGVSNRIPGGDWIYDWVQNSTKLIQSGDPYALKIWTTNNKVTMDPFPNLTRDDIDLIMGYIDGYFLY